MDYGMYRYSDLMFRETGSRKAHGVEDLSVDSSDDIDNKISQILKDISQGNISIENAIAKLKSLGVEVQETSNNSNVTFTFSYNNKSYTLRASRQKSFEEIAKEYDANYIADCFQGSLSAKYDPKADNRGLKEDLVNFVKEICNTKAGEVLKNLIGGRSIEELVTSLMREVPVGDYTTNGSFIEGFRDLLSAIVTRTPNRINEQYKKIENEKAAEAAEQARLEQEAQKVQDFYKKLPTKGFDSFEALKDYISKSEYAQTTIIDTVYKDNDNTYYRVYNPTLKFDGVSVTIPNEQKPEEPADITLEEPINNDTEEIQIKKIGNKFISREEAAQALQGMVSDAISEMRSNSTYSEEYIAEVEKYLLNKVEFLLPAEIPGMTTLVLLDKITSDFKDIVKELKNPNPQDSLSNNTQGFTADLINSVFEKSKDALGIKEYTDFVDEFTSYVAKMYGAENELEENGYINLLEVIKDENGDGNSLNELFEKAKQFVTDTLTDNLPFTGYSEKELEKYELTKEDIQLFLTKKDGRYTVNENIVKSIFGNDTNIKTIEEFFDAIKNIGITESMLRGGYKLDSDEIEKYFTVINQSPRRMVLNESAIKAKFPDLTINTPGQLLSVLGPSEIRYGNGNYTKDYLTGNCQFTEEDLSLYFSVNRAGKYSIKQDYIKQILPDVEIKTVQDLVNNIKDASYDSDFIMHSEFIHYMDCFTEVEENSKKKFKLNQNMLKEKFPDKDIRTLGQLKEALNGCENNFELGDIDDYKLASYNLGYLKDYGLNDEIINEYFVKDDNDKYVLNESSLKTRFPNDTIKTAEELLNAIKAHKTTFSSRDELINKFGLSEIMVDSFFKQNPDGTYSYDIENMKYYFVDNEIPYTIEDLKNADLYVEFWKQGTELYATVSGDEMTKYLNALKNVSIARYTEDGIRAYADFIDGPKYDYIAKYDKDFIEKAFDTVFSNTDILRYSNKHSINDTLQMFMSEVRSVMHGEYDIMHSLMGKIYGYTPTEFVNSVFVGLSSDDYKVRFSSQMLSDTFNELDLNNNELCNLMEIIFKEYGKVKNIYPTGQIRYDGFNFITYESGPHDSGSDLYNLCKIIKEKAANIKHMEPEEIQAATTIDSSALFTDSNFLNAEYIESHLSEMLLSDDPGVRKFATMVEDLFKKTINNHGDTIEEDANTKAKKLDRIKWLITLLNEQCGVQNPSGNPSTTNVGLTPELIEKLGSNAFEKIENVLYSQKLDNCIKADVNGIIDDVQQGSEVGNCWILSGIISLSATDKGREIIQNAVHWNSDYTKVIVTFKGYGDTVEIPVEALLNADPDLGNNYYNWGDNDVLAIVLAWDMLHKKYPYRYPDLDSDTSDTFFERFVGGEVDTEYDTWEYVTSWFSGDKVEMDYADVLEILTNIARNWPNVAATFSLGTATSSHEEYSWTTVDGKTESIQLSGHVFAIVDMSPPLITFVNPWDSSEKYTVHFDTFIRLGIKSICTCML